MGHRRSSKWARKKIRLVLRGGGEKKYFRFISHSMYRIGLRCSKISRVVRKVKRKLERVQCSRCGGGREMGDIMIENHSIRVILKPRGTRLLVISIYENGVYP